MSKTISNVLTNKIFIELTNFFDSKPEVMVLDASRIIAFRQNSDKTTSILLEGFQDPVVTTVWESELQWILHEIRESGMIGGTFRYDGRDESIQAAIRAFRVQVLGWPEQTSRPTARQRADAFGAGRQEAKRRTGAADTDRVGPGRSCPECGDNVADDDYVLDRALPDGELFTGCLSCYQRAADEQIAEHAAR